jgi:hypothetical protein
MVRDGPGTTMARVSEADLATEVTTHERRGLA